MTKTTAQKLDAAQDLLNQLEAALSAGDMTRAHGLAERIMAAGGRHPVLYNVLAHRAERQGRFDEAIGLLRQGLEHAPSDVQLITSVGFLTLKLERAGEAAMVFDAAVRIDPAFAPAVYGRGSARFRAGDPEGARQDYATAVKLAPGYADALAGLSALAADRGDLDQARAFADQALETDPGHPIAGMARAKIAFSDGAYEEAERRVRALIAERRLGTTDRAAARLALGDALDRQGRIAEAFAAYVSGKSEYGRYYGPRYAAPGVEAAAAVARRVAAAVEALPVTAPAEAPAQGAEGAAQHVFVVGMPLSGEGEIARLLAGVPDVVVLSDRPLLLEAEAAFVVPDDGMDRLAAADEAELDHFRAQYWQTVRAHGVEPAGKTFVDKTALNLVRLPLIARLFPQAKIVLAVRDPRDVALDDFRAAFAVTAGTFPFTTLQGAARYYQAAMEVLAAARKRLPLQIEEVRYEALDEAKAGLGAFLGLDLSAVPTPQTHAGAWRAYAAHMGEVLPGLQPWVERFGYPAE